MKILLYLYYPFFDDHLAGGVQAFIRKLVDSIVNKNNDIELTIVCPKSDLHAFPHGLNLYPFLNDIEKDNVDPLQIKENINLLNNCMRDVDLIWVVDRHFPIITNKPTVLLLNTICYERELNSFLFCNWNKLIAVSEYEKNQLLKCNYKTNNIEVIPLFIDKIFSKRDKKDFYKLNSYFKVDNTRKYILFPHRAEKEKGHDTALLLIDELKKHDSSYCLLIPEPGDSKLSDYSNEKNYIIEIKEKVKQLRLEGNVVFHKWINYKMLPVYYSLGCYTLFFSELPETFGLSLIHSVACGTPVISYGVGALCQTVPPGKAHVVVNKCSIKEMVDIIKKGVRGELINEDVEHVNELYSINDVVNKYITLFKNC